MGETAIVQNRFRFAMNSTESGTSDSTLLFRTSNLLGEVIWRREDVKADADVADEDTAVAAARLVAAALAKAE
ncbi:hypothetical protein ACFQYP_30865 [Nonomuraea antimicrobica]